jgi:hypothetical protein
VSRSDPRPSVLRAVGRELRWRPAARRRLLMELEHHIDDTADALQQSGLPRNEATQEALRRLGDADTILRVVHAAHTPQRWRQGLRRLRSPAWIAVGAVSLVAVWAAELPQASGAKPTPRSPERRHVTLSPRVGHHGCRVLITGCWPDRP